MSARVCACKNAQGWTPAMIRTRNKIARTTSTTHGASAAVVPKDSVEGTACVELHDRDDKKLTTRHHTRTSNQQQGTRYRCKSVLQRGVHSQLAISETGAVSLETHIDGDGVGLLAVRNIRMLEIVDRGQTNSSVKTTHLP
jgi:hypothetical protein